MESNVTIDENASHPTLVFIQDKRTLATVALDRATGKPIGLYASGMTQLSTLFRAVAEYQLFHGLVLS